MVGQTCWPSRGFADIVTKQLSLTGKLTSDLCAWIHWTIVTRISGVDLVRSLGVVNPVAEIFDYSRKNVRFSGKISDFPGKNSDDAKIVFYPKVFTCSPFTPTFFTNFSLFLIKKILKRRLLAHFLCKIGYSIFRDLVTTSLRPPATPTTTPLPGLTPMTRISGLSFDSHFKQVLIMIDKQIFISHAFLLENL